MDAVTAVAAPVQEASPFQPGSVTQLGQRWQRSEICGKMTAYSRHSITNPQHRDRIMASPVGQPEARRPATGGYYAIFTPHLDLRTALELEVAMSLQSAPVCRNCAVCSAYVFL